MAGKCSNNLIGCLFLGLKPQISAAAHICEFTSREDGNLALCPQTSLFLHVHSHSVAGAHSNNVIILE